MKPLSKQPKEEFIKTVQDYHRESADVTHEWRKEARESYGYVGGLEQWTNEDIMLRGDKPSVAFNRTGPFIDAVVGMEVQNRQEIRYLPREEGDAGVNELLTGAVEWIRDQTDAEDEETEAFVDLVVTGMGFTDSEIDFEEDDEGILRKERFDGVGECFWDPMSSRRNLKDSKWRMRIRPWAISDVKDEWPDLEEGEINNAWEVENWLDEEPTNAATAWMYRNDSNKDRLPQGQVNVVKFQWYEIEKYHRILIDDQFVDVPASRFNKIRPILEESQYSFTENAMPKRVYWQAYIVGNAVAEKKKMKVSRFTINAMTGKRDRNKRMWYGLVRSLKDPQRWTNIFFSNLIYQMATTGKGIIAEQGVFPNIHRAEQDWAKADSIVEVEPGAITNGRIMPKPQQPYPQGIDRLMEFSIGSFNDVTGMPVELLGLTGVNQPGVVEHQRKSSGIAILSWAFDALRRYRKEDGRLTGEYIREYFADGRLVRINGDAGRKYAPLVKDELSFKYDVIIDEAPSSANQKERVWAILDSLLPKMIQMGMPIPPEIISYLPIPESLQQKWLQMLRPDPQQQEAQQKEAAEQAMLQKQAAQTQIEKDASVAYLNRIKGQKEQQMIQPEVEQTVLENEKLAAETGQLL